jgi:hypothetical protein
VRESPFARTTTAAAVVLACVVAAIAFVAYTKTLLPGVDLGDTGGFQAAVLWPEISARQAYPLYYALAKPFVGTVSPANPARGLNLFSAVWAAGAVGVLAAVTASVTGSLVGGAAAGLLLAFSYTFWSQAVIAEVYSLHLALVGACLVALAAYARHPRVRRLALFFAVYALAFGNHLSMILLLVPFAVFLLLTAARAADLLRPRVIVLAVAIAFVGALQYVPNLLAVWTSLDAPERWTDRIAAFWFDVTKEDWRESMVLGVPGSELRDRLALFIFDARQQFTIAGLALAAAGAGILWRANRPWGVLIILAYAINTAFAFTYNVGDPHAFFLPGHYFTAFAFGCAAGAAATNRSRAIRLASVAAVALFLGWRAYDTWPIADRHEDRRAEYLASRLTFGLDERRDLLVTALNWQIENVLLYTTRYEAPQVAWARLGDVFLHFPLLVRDNHDGGRDVVLTSDAAAQVAAAFGPLLQAYPDPLPPTPTLRSTIARIPRGAAYVLALLTPPRDEVLDVEQVSDAVASLTGGADTLATTPAYEVIAGHAGEKPVLHRASSRPFRERVALAEGAIDIRMESFVPLETFRRSGFGHVMVNREHILFVERGLSVVWLDPRGLAEPFYAAGLYAPRPRFRLPAGGTPGFALLH